MSDSRSDKRKKRSKKKIIIGNIVGLAIIGVFALGVFGASKLYPSMFGKGDSTASAEKKKPQEVKPKPTDIIKGNNTTYEGKNYSVAAKDVEAMLNNTYVGEGKKVFLTFDDGPSPNTEKVLDVLDKEGVKATFFVLGERLEDEKSKVILKRTLEGGHAIANHSYTHNLKKLYPGRKVDVHYFMEEFNKTNNLMKEILGEDFNSKVLRMPGGEMSRRYYKDANLPELRETFAKDNIYSIDWNALNGDAEGKKYTTEEMMNKVIKSTGDQENVVILMHDTFGKQKTAEMLPQIIKFYKEKGYEFKTISN
ncbi:MAG: polysaccharide deacetylase family protein [Clostridium sp.]